MGEATTFKSPSNRLGLRNGDQAVPIVALAGLEAEVGDEAMHIGDAHLEGGAGGGDDIFLEHDGAEVVGAVLKGDLSDVLALGDPGTLDTGNIVEVDPGQGLGAQVIMGADGGGFEDGVFGLESPADEGGEGAAVEATVLDGLSVGNGLGDAGRNGVEVGVA